MTRRSFSLRDVAALVLVLLVAGCNQVLGIERATLESRSGVEGCDLARCKATNDAGRSRCEATGCDAGPGSVTEPDASASERDAAVSSFDGGASVHAADAGATNDGGAASTSEAARADAASSAQSACASNETDCDGLVPRRCAQGQLQPAGAACPYACQAGRCTGECRDGETRCSGNVFERCESARFVATATCPGTCESQTGCGSGCMQGSFDCDGARQRTQCNADGSWAPAELCSFVCLHGVCGDCDPAMVTCADAMTAQSCDADAHVQTQICAHGCKDGACLLCASGDGVCPVGCDAQSDGDCAKDLGASCANDGDCRLGHCANGVCCDRACNGACEACNLASSPGTCATQDFTSSSDPMHCGACDTACSTANIGPSCSAGVCDGACAPHFDDCNHDKRSDGCETALDSDPNHCGDCATVCPYGVCQTGACASDVFGFPRAGTTSINLGANTQECVGVHISKAGLLAALGAQTITANAGLRIGLYRDDGSGAPQELVAQTDALTTVASAATEGRVPLTAVSVADYWLCLLTNATLRVAAEPGTTTWWYASLNYGTLPPSAGKLTSAQVARGDLYAVTVPATQGP